MTKSTGIFSDEYSLFADDQGEQEGLCAGFWYSFLMSCFFSLLNVGARVTLLLAERMPGKNVRAKAHLCMHRPYPSLSTTWNNMQIGASTSIILFIVFTHFQFDFSYNSGSKQLINTIGLLDFVSHQHHVFIFWKGWWNTNSIRKTLLARASVLLHHSNVLWVLCICCIVCLSDTLTNGLFSTET